MLLMLPLQGMHAASDRTFFANVTPSPRTCDADVVALAHAFEKLKVGPKVRFAQSMNEEGVVKLSDLGLVGEAEARRVMARAGMSELQQNKVLHSVPKFCVVPSAPPSAPYQALDKQVVRLSRFLQPLVLAFFHDP